MTLLEKLNYPHFDPTIAQEVYEAYCNKQFSEEVWSEYCVALVEKLMKENRDVLERLKNI